MSYRYLPEPTAYVPGQPRVFVPFEDRKRDLTELLEFGTVITVFKGAAPWQLTQDTIDQYAEAMREFFRAHEFGDRDFLVAIGDPLVIATTFAVAAQQNHGRATVLRWDRLPCSKCGRFRWSSGCPIGKHEDRGRYSPVTAQLPLD